ncbi:Uncharacterized protein conserved in bacteria (DUF2326) [Yersinia enterocolitica]|uniref:Uncharacterized protein conserved in bacteria (DUF2326) n=1 Tax=Yersinia enterocolitica TaxID=630 RepID=A0A9P1PR68_YEREN|nr:DUF2326 domain-containing protein [Yersinia enterocolitica]CNE88076.1 Uncharacterized protein conserved in bacteria (DUF2326) [Yersinia enterocolitica]
MRLNKLTVYKDNEAIREVPFVMGLNLVINRPSIGKESGNSVGKSTLSRLIDYLFTSSGEDIYHDLEFGKSIVEIENLISMHTILIELCFTSYDNNDYKIARTLKQSEKDTLYYIDECVVSKVEYIEFISKYIFGIFSSGPSIRNLSHKFIRNTHNKMQNTIKFLYEKTTGDTYDQLYLFLFGFEGLPLLKQKTKINREISKNERNLTAYRSPHKESVLKKLIKPLNTEINTLELDIKSFDFKDSHTDGVKKLVNVQSVISDLSINYSSYIMRINMLEKSIYSLKKGVSSIENNDLKIIYESANVYVTEKLVASYEEMLDFHNRIIKNKVEFLEEDLQSKRKKAEEINNELNSLHESESSLFKTIKEPETLKSITQMFNKLSDLKDNLSSIKVNLDRIEETKKTIVSLKNESASIIKSINDSLVSLDGNLEIFNEYFGKITKLIYGDRYIFDLNFDSEKGKCQFDISCVTPNSTGGKKKGELTAFDLAYIEFVNKVKLKRPTFIIHDSIEDVDINQIRDIFNYAKSLNGQYIVSILSDKFSSKEDKEMIKGHSILELSEDDKFFKI